MQIPCQKHNLKPILTDYIYRIISSKNQKSKPWEMDLPLLKNDITGSEPTVKMLDTLQVYGTIGRCSNWFDQKFDFNFIFRNSFILINFLAVIWLWSYIIRLKRLLF